MWPHSCLELALWKLHVFVCTEKKSHFQELSKMKMSPVEEKKVCSVLLQKISFDLK